MVLFRRALLGLVIQGTLQFSDQASPPIGMSSPATQMEARRLAQPTSPWALPPSSLGPGPSAWARAEPEDEGLGSEVLAAAAAGVVEDLPGRQCWLVFRNGKLIQEEYYRGVGPDTLHEGDSAMKVATAMVMGVAWTKGLFDLDRTLLSYGVEPDAPWNREPARTLFYPSLTARHLLGQVSGLGYCAPGTQFTYSSDSGIQHLEKLLARVTGTNQTVQWATDHFARPLGLPELFLTDGEQLSIGGGQMATCSGLARLGQLILNRGLWRETTGDPVRLVSEEFIAMMSQPSFPAVAVTHGFLLWVSEPPSQAGQAPGPRCCYPRWGAAPACSYKGTDENYHIYRDNGTMLGDDLWLNYGKGESVYMALGWLSRLMFILPIRDMILISIGNTIAGSTWCDLRFGTGNGDQAYVLALIWRRFQKALPLLPSSIGVPWSGNGSSNVSWGNQSAANTTADNATNGSLLDTDGLNSTARGNAANNAGAEGNMSEQAGNSSGSAGNSMPDRGAGSATSNVSGNASVNGSSTAPSNASANGSSIAPGGPTPAPPSSWWPVPMYAAGQPVALRRARAPPWLSLSVPVEGSTSNSPAPAGGCYCFCKPDQGFGSCFAAPPEASETNNACAAFGEAAAALCPALGVVQECRIADPGDLQWERFQAGRPTELSALVSPCIGTEYVEQQDFHCRPQRNCTTALGVNGTPGDFGTCLCEARFVECTYDPTPCSAEDTYTRYRPWPPSMRKTAEGLSLSGTVDAVAASKATPHHDGVPWVPVAALLFALVSLVAFPCLRGWRPRSAPRRSGESILGYTALRDS